MDLLRALITVSLLPICTRAHMQMSNPYPIDSPLNPATPEYLKDYSYTSPLLSDGSNYPCKGYQTQSTSYNTTATYSAGGMYSMSIAGSASHGGGSCQLSLSYDNGQTFKVIESMIGGCPITTTYNFTIPSFAPSSQSALFAWTWFNEIGNREMYMNCARVKIQAAVPGRHRRAQYKRQDTIGSLPDLFVCDIANGCTTIEQEDVQFPNPGSNVVYGSDDGSYPPPNGTGFIGSGYPPNSTAATMAPAMPTSGPYANIATTASSVPFLNTTASTTITESTSTLVLTDVVTIATTILVTPTSSSLSHSLASAFSSAVIAAMTVPTTILASTTPSPILLQIFSNTSSLFSPSSTSSSQSRTYWNSTSSLFSTAFPQSPTSSSTTSFPTSFSTASPTSTTSAPALSITTTMATPTSSSTPASATLLLGACIPGAFACNSPSTFSQCVAGPGGTSSYTYMGSVAAGMECSNGQIIRQNDGPCTPSGQLFCNGEYAFYLCNQGGLINMGPVAPGTACVNATIGFPLSRR